ncbi:hypothetical protein IFR05_013383 [Cadophora sp. M221]|nr:hypothetical protein IFR05_013383 [Cadophora sp. M221]
MANAFKRLEDEIHKFNKCLQDLHLSNPRDEKKRIEETNGGLLKDSYCWILESSDFRQWSNDQRSRLLWIKGDPGKGKTMLLCGMDLRINHATAVMRGLLYHLLRQEPSLISYIQKAYDHTGKALFEAVEDNAVEDDCYGLEDDLDDAADKGPALFISIAARGGHLVVVERLLQEKSDVNIAAVLRNGRTALQAAVEGGRLAVVDRLLQEKAAVNAAAAESDGRTALQVAAESGNLVIVDRLLQEKAAVNMAVVSRNRRSALQAEAAEGGLTDQKLLHEAGAI